MAEQQQEQEEASAGAMAVCEHLQRQGLQAQLFSDIIICFHGKEYRLHRIILCQSSYFRSLLAGPWRESGKPRVDLRIDDVNVSFAGLDAALGFLYGAPPALSAANVAATLAAACFLCIDNLAQLCVRFMLRDLRADTFLAYHHLSHHHCYGRFAHAIRDACWTFLASHAAKELLHLLPKLSLQYLCRMLKSDELWILSESERYKLAKQVLLDWKLARIKACSSVSDGGCSSKKLRVIKSFSRRAARTSAITAAASKNSNKAAQSKSNSKDKSKAKKDTDKQQQQQQLHHHQHQQRDDAPENALKKLRRLWEEDPGGGGGGDEAESFDMVVDLFTGGGIIYAYMDPAEALQTRKELEEAQMPADVVNDSIWQNVLLKARIIRDGDGGGGGERTYSASSSSEDEDEDDDDDDDDDDDLPLASDDDSSDWSSGSSSGDEDENNNNNNNHNNNNNNIIEQVVAAGEGGGVEAAAATGGLKRTSTELVCYNAGEEEAFDGKRRKTSGGFTWAAKLDAGMQMSDFPPFRFGAEFAFVNKAWGESEQSLAQPAFYGGSRWKIIVSGGGKEWLVAVECRPGTYCKVHAYEDWRKKVLFSAKLYIRTSEGLQCVKGSGQRTSKTGPPSLSSKYHVGAIVTSKEIPKDKPLRVVAVVQLE